jgi:hypothetical protein
MKWGWLGVAIERRFATKRGPFEMKRGGLQ